VGRGGGSLAHSAPPGSTFVVNNKYIRIIPYGVCYYWECCLFNQSSDFIWRSENDWRNRSLTYKACRKLKVGTQKWPSLRIHFSHWVKPLSAVGCDNSTIRTYFTIILSLCSPSETLKICEKNSATTWVMSFYTGFVYC